MPTVGYHRALSAEAILAMKPTLILHNNNNNGPEHVIKQPEAEKGNRFLIMDEPLTFQNVYSQYHFMENEK